MIIKYSTGGNTYNSGTALHKGCYDGDMALLECLLGIEGLALGLSDKRQWQAVHFAAWRGNHEALLRLLEDDRVDVNARASPGSS
jgi:Ankyrin repeats (many copies)